jgi:predicted ATPase
VNDATLMAATLVATLAPGDVSSKAPAVRLLDLLSHQRLLLLLDNLEQIDGAASLIAMLLAECPGVTILATSRERLHLRAEQRCKVPPLELAAAVALFTQRSQAVDENFALNDENRSTIAAICTRLDCLPLALELCAAQIELFAPAQLLAQLQARPLDLLIDGAHDLPPQQRTLRQAIYCSYMLLNERRQALFRALGVFVGGWTLEAAEQVADRSHEHSLTFALLHQLVNKSLVIAEKQGELTRYRMLETIRDYAREKLVEQGEEASVCEQHAAYFLQLAEQVHPLLFTTEQQVAYQRLIEEQNNFRAALHWWRTTNQYAGVARLSAALCWFWWKHGNLRTEAHWAEWALKAMACHDTKAPNAIRTKALYAVAFGTQCLGDWSRARILYEEYLQIASQPYAFIDFYAVLGELAAVFRMEGDYRQAKILEERRLAWSREHAFPNGVADALMQLGCHAHSQGDLMQARQLLQESLDLRKAVGAITGIAHTQAILGVVAYKQGNLAQSLQLLHETLELCRTLGDKHGTGWTFSDLGVVAQLQQAYEEATHYQHKALALARELGYQHMAALVLGRLGNLALIRNDGERARTYYLESLALYQQIGFPKSSAVGLEGLAGVAALNSRPRDAAYLLAVAETCHQKIGSVRPLEQQAIHERTVTIARTALGDAQFEAVYLHGRTTALDDAVLPVLTHPTHGQ